MDTNSVSREQCSQSTQASQPERLAENSPVFDGRTVEQVIQQRLSAGYPNININTEELEDLPILHKLTRNGDIVAVENHFMFRSHEERKEEMHKQNNRGQTALHEAIASNQFEILEIFLNAGADVNAQDNNGQTGLHLAASQGNVAMIQALLKKDTNIINITDKAGFTALYCAVKKNHPEAINLLVGHEGLESIMGRALRLLQTSQASQLREAANLIQIIVYFRCQEAFIGKLGGTKINLFSGVAWTLQEGQFHYAIELIRSVVYLGGAEALRTYLQNQGVSIDARSNANQVNWGNADKDNWLKTGTALHIAAARGDSEGILALIDAGANVDVLNIDLYTPLHMAAAYGHVEAIQALLDAGADIDIQNSNGWTPLHMATEPNRIQAIEALIQLGADVTIRDNDGMRAEDIARNNGFEKTFVQLLVEHAQAVARKGEAMFF